MSDPETTMTDGLIDRPKSVREGEDLDVDALEAWLRANTQLLGPRDEVAILQFPSGYSNLTYLLRLGETETVLPRTVTRSARPSPLRSLSVVNGTCASSSGAFASAIQSDQRP